MAENNFFRFQGLTLYEPELEHLKNAPDGDVGIYLRKRGEAIIVAAKRQVGVDTGALRESIKMVHNRGFSGQYIQIGSDLNYAYMHHEGTRPHIERPNTHKMMRFTSGSRVIYTHQVMHPGTRPNRFLSDQLPIALV